MEGGDREEENGEGQVKKGKAERRINNYGAGSGLRFVRARALSCGCPQPTVASFNNDVGAVVCPPFFRRHTLNCCSSRVTDDFPSRDGQSSSRIAPFFSLTPLTARVVCRKGGAGLGEEG